ncbi:MAG: Unknown protein [uncultured Sulfurovum sp.]|uniref:Uncharacterized protein n=1 Tax=uncultured Sulfurovum sp. TaxID=269237 RepID=A0A6S6SGD9_9BACT|nr:MAG: Unknown protein [uncultured Sulfurovum sp.]
MKPIMIKKTITALTIILLSQPLFATTANYSNDCFSDTEKTVTIDVNKFTHVWLNLHNNNNNVVSHSQDHLQSYLENALDNTQGTLDVAQFADVWDKAGNRPTEDHLTKRLDEMLENTSAKNDCYYATDENTLDVTKFADVWDKAGNRPAEDHLTKRLAKMVENSDAVEDCDPQ